MQNQQQSYGQSLPQWARQEPQQQFQNFSQQPQSFQQNVGQGYIQQNQQFPQNVQQPYGYQQPQQSGYGSSYGLQNQQNFGQQSLPQWARQEPPRQQY